jgi:hypothetical protein
LARFQTVIAGGGAHTPWAVAWLGVLSRGRASVGPKRHGRARVFAGYTPEPSKWRLAKRINNGDPGFGRGETIMDV